MGVNNVYNTSSLYDRQMSNFMGIGMVVGFLLPHTSTLFLIINPLICIFYKCFRTNRTIYRFNWIVIIPVLLSLFINYPQGVEMKSIYSCLAILIYFSCFPMVGNYQIPNLYFYVVLLVVLISQLAYVLNIPALTSLLDTYYPISEDDNSLLYMRSNVSYDNMLEYRLGGLYRNSNQCSRYLTFLLAGYLILNKDKNILKLIPFIIITIIGVILTGSRTGFSVTSLFIIFFSYRNSQISRWWRYIIVFLLAGYFLFMVTQNTGFIRGTNIENGLEGSMSLKFETFLYYLKNEHSVFRILFGYLDVTRYDYSHELMSKFDSDYGSIIFSYGFVGFFSIIFYFFTILKRMGGDGRIFFILLLWMFSSTIVKSFRALFLFMLLLSFVYQRNKLTIYKVKD